MRVLLGTFLAMLPLCGVASAASTEDVDVNLRINVPAYCSTLNDVSITDSATNRTFGQNLIDDSAKPVANGSADIMNPVNVVCNGKTSVSFETEKGGLLLVDGGGSAVAVTPVGQFNGSSSGSGWMIPYALQVKWGTSVDDVSSQTTSGNGGDNLASGVSGFSNLKPTNANFEVSISLPNAVADVPFIAGNYADKLTITFNTVAL